MKKKWLTQCQWLLGMRPRISYHPLNKAAEGIKPLRLLERNAAQQTVRIVECSSRAELQTPREREERKDIICSYFTFCQAACGKWSSLWVICRAGFRVISFPSRDITERVSSFTQVVFRPCSRALWALGQGRECTRGGGDTDRCMRI